MELEPKFGQMELSMKVNGLQIKQTVRENSGMQMAMFMKESGRTIKQMDKECMFM